jgi:hypothetical protein
MKKLFFILVILNLVFWGVVKLYETQAPIDWRAREIQAERVKIVTGQSALSPSPIPAVASEAMASAVIAAVAPTSVPASVPASAPSAATLTCRRLLGVTPDLLATARSRIKSARLEAEERSVGETRFWVYIPPLASAEAARKKAEELAGLGIDDFYPINNGSKWQNAVSLGVYSTREAGEKRLAALRASGVRSAQLRDKDDTPRPATFTFKALQAEDLEKLEKISKQLRGTQVQSCF